jgi:hypothetical protein
MSRSIDVEIRTPVLWEPERATASGDPVGEEQSSSLPRPSFTRLHALQENAKSFAAAPSPLLIGFDMHFSTEAALDVVGYLKRVAPDPAAVAEDHLWPLCDDFSADRFHRAERGSYDGERGTESIDWFPHPRDANHAKLRGVSLLGSLHARPFLGCTGLATYTWLDHGPLRWQHILRRNHDTGR